MSNVSISTISTNIFFEQIGKRVAVILLEEKRVKQTA
jgi:hypothetical protein